MPTDVQLVRQRHRIADQLPFDEVPVRGRPNRHPPARGCLYGGPRDLQLLLRRQREQVIRNVVVPGDLGGAAVDAARRHSPQAHLLDRPGDPDGGFQVYRGVVIVEYGRGAGAGGFQGRQPDTGPGFPGADRLCVGPHELAQPRIQRHTFAEAASQALEHMGMGVDEARDDRFSGAVDHPRRSVVIEILRRAHRRDPISADGHRPRFQHSAFVVDGDDRSIGKQHITMLYFLVHHCHLLIYASYRPIVIGRRPIGNCIIRGTESSDRRACRSDTGGSIGHGLANRTLAIFRRPGHSLVM